MTDGTTLSEAAVPEPPDGTGTAGTVLAPDEDAALGALMAYFGRADDRQAARVVVGGVELGVIDRDRALDLVEVKERGIDDSALAGLPGAPTGYEAIPLRCPVPDCPANPIEAWSFDERHPLRCPRHPGQPLALVDG